MSQCKARAERAESLLAKARDAIADYSPPRWISRETMLDVSKAHSWSESFGELRVVLAEIRAAEEERG